MGRGVRVGVRIERGADEIRVVVEHRLLVLPPRAEAPAEVMEPGQVGDDVHDPGKHDEREQKAE